MTQLEYAQLLRSMHRIAGWCFIGSIILSPIGVLILRRGNRIYESIVSSEGSEDGRILEGETVERSLIVSWDDLRDVDP